jgi:lysophospholipase L1-like esterase
MASGSGRRSGARVARALLVAVGAALIGYAVSDHPFYGGEPGFGRAQTLITAVGVGLSLSALLPGAVAARVLLVAFASLFALALAEVVGELALGPRLRPVYQADSQLIFRLVPNRRSVLSRSPVNGGVTVAYRINSAGFRGEELLQAGEALRLVVYGDSFIHAPYSADGETFAARLAAALSGRVSGRVEVVNGGVSSYGPDQVALKMAQELPWLRPDLVLVAVFAGNDYGDLLRNKIFRLAPEGGLVENRWRLDPKVRIWLDLNLRESILLRAVRETVKSLRAGHERYENLTRMDFLLEEAEREYQSFVLDRDDVVTNTHVDYYSADVSLRPGSRSASYKVALMQAVVGRIREIAARHRVRLAFLLIPHPVDVADRQDWGGIDRERFPDYAPRNQIGFLEEIMRAADIPYLSLFDLYRSSDADSLYFRGGDDHWNARGQKIAAEAMADYLIAKGLLPAGRRAPQAHR